MTTGEPWAQQLDEPDAAYGRFLAYLHLGPGRSIDAAARAAANRGRTQRRRASGQWFADASRFRWVERAARWDVHQLTTAGAAAAANYVKSLERLSSKTLAAFEREDVAISTWAEAVAALVALSTMIPPSFLTRLLHEPVPSGEGATERP